MAKQRVLVVGGGLAGLAATMKLAELGIAVDLMSLTPVKRSHSVCAQGGINAVNDLTRQQGDSEWQHFDDTVYGGDFLQHQPPVKEMAYSAPKIIDLMDRLGVPFNRTPEGFRDQRRFGGTLFKRTAFAGATTGQQLLYALDEQVRRWDVEGLVTKYECWDFLGPILDDDGRCRGAVAQDLVTMEIRAFPADAVVIATGGCGLIYGRSTMSMACTGSAASRCVPGRRQVRQRRVHPGPPDGHPRRRQAAADERVGPRRRAAACGCRARRRTPAPPKTIPEAERYYFLEERYPKYGNLVPRDIATREIFNVCVNEGLSVEARPAVRLPRPDAHPARRARPQAGRHPADLREVPGRRSARRADEDLPRRPLLDGRPVGRLRALGRRRARRRLAPQPPDQHPGPVRHRRVRLPVPRRQPPRAPTRCCPASSPACSSPRASRICLARSRNRPATRSSTGLIRGGRATRPKPITTPCSTAPAAARIRT